MIHQAKSLGYEVDLIFIGLDGAERSLSRIRSRVAAGGHDIPDEDAKRRYSRSIANAVEALQLADVARFYDNSGDRARLVLLAYGGRIVWKADPLPEWLRL